MVGAPGEGWALAMTIVAHEREPAELGFSARYGKLVRDLVARAGQRPPTADLIWAQVETEMPRASSDWEPPDVHDLLDEIDVVADGPLRIIAGDREQRL